MINVTFYLQGKSLCGFEFSGHSDYASSGEDIVCAAVSSAAYLTANNLTDVFGFDADVTVSEGYMKVTSKPAENADLLYKGLHQHMLQLQEQYNKEINVKIMEV